MRKVLQRIIDAENVKVPERAIEQIIEESVLDDSEDGEYKGVPRDAVRKLYTLVKTQKAKDKMKKG